MKITQVTLGFPPYQIGGTVHLSYLLSAGLAQKKSAEVSVFTGGLPLDYKQLIKDEKFENIMVRRIKTFPGNYLTSKSANVEIETYKNHYAEKQFEDFIRNIKPDIVHFQHTIRLSASLIFLAKKYTRKTIVSLQDFWYFCPRIHLLKPNGSVCGGPEFGLNCYYCKDNWVPAQRKSSRTKAVNKSMRGKIPTSVKALVRNILEKRRGRITEAACRKIYPYNMRFNYVTEALKNADYIICPSEFLKESYVNLGNIDSSKIATIPLGIVPFKREKKDSIGQPVRFGFVGSPKRHKGSHILLEVFKRIPPKEGKLIIWGRGWKKVLNRRKCSYNVDYKGEYTHEIIGKVFASFDILVIPSTWGETFSFIAHESFFAKVPVIACDMGVFPDIISNEKNGLLFRTNDANSLFENIMNVIKKPQMIQKMARGIKIPKDSIRYVNEIYALYKRILNPE